MATESVETAIPGMKDLLIGECGFSNPHDIANAAENCLRPLAEGVAAIGDLMWHAGCSEGTEIEKETLRKLGCLLQQLGELTGQAARIQAGALEQMAEPSPRPMPPTRPTLHLV